MFSCEGLKLTSSDFRLVYVTMHTSAGGCEVVHLGGSTNEDLIICILNGACVN